MTTPKLPKPAKIYPFKKVIIIMPTRNINLLVSNAFAIILLDGGKQAGIK